MKNLNCVIVNDSPEKRESLRNLIQSHPNLNLVHCFRNAIEAVEGINCRHVDLAFIAIEMPIRNGFQLIEALINRPQIIIVSEKSEYALKAIEYNVTDYLLGEIDEKRFDNSIQKAIEKENSQYHTESNNSSIFINYQQYKKKLILAHIKWIEAMGDYTKIITDEETIIISSGLKKFMDKIQGDNFIRIHKSFVVNKDRIEHYDTKSVTIENHVIPISRSKKLAFKQALQAS